MFSIEVPIHWKFYCKMRNMYVFAKEPLKQHDRPNISCIIYPEIFNYNIHIHYYLYSYYYIHLDYLIKEIILKLNKNWVNFWCFYEPHC